MVYPAGLLQIRVWSKGRSTTASTDKLPIMDVETLDFTFSNGVENWTPYETSGWQRALMTAKAASVTVTAKRNIGDAGNDYIAGLFMTNGEDANSGLDITFPGGSVFSMPAVVNVTSIGGGAATDVSPLVAEFQSDGEPTYTPATT